MAKTSEYKKLMAGRGQAADADRTRLGWWRDARFGMFVHWGLYAKAGGAWKGRPVPGIGEWIMFNARIPVAEYENLARDFNPIEFDAEHLVGLAKRAGAGYLVITAKHHEGFAMFHSHADTYNIVDATPFERDPLAELAAACRRADIRLGFYYSQDQDWHDPDGSWNSWDFDESKKDFDAYFRRKCIPQLRELLTNYGPVALIWFDTPYTMDEAHSRELRDLVRSLQPECLVSGRIGSDLGDYGSLGDNQIPLGPISGDYETPATMNDTWGYKADDTNWKPTEDLLSLLIDLASKGINYLLNVGPTETGAIPAESEARLKEIGDWLKVNGDAIYGTSAGPFAYELPWGRITAKSNTLYLIFTNADKSTAEDGFMIHGLRNEVLTAYPLAHPDHRLGFTQFRVDEIDLHVLNLDIPQGSISGKFPVVVLELDGEPEADTQPVQQPDGTVILPANMARICTDSPGEVSLNIDRTGFTDSWWDTEESLCWEFKIAAPGEYLVEVFSSGPRIDDLTGLPIVSTAEKPHEIAIEFAGGLLPGRIRLESPVADMGEVSNPRSRYFPEVVTRAGIIELSAPGIISLGLSATYIDQASENGLELSGIRLTSIG